MIEVKKGRTGELPGIKCDLCEGNHTSFATHVVWVLGRPLFQTCQRHRATAREMWAGALDAEEKAA